MCILYPDLEKIKWKMKIFLYSKYFRKSLCVRKKIVEGLVEFESEKGNWLV